MRLQVKPVYYRTFHFISDCKKKMQEKFEIVRMGKMSRRRSLSFKSNLCEETHREREV